MAISEERAAAERDVARHEKLLREISDQLVKWANESRSGGWSTHQVQPQLDLASKIQQHILS